MQITSLTVDGLPDGCVTDEAPRIAFALASERAGESLATATLTVGDWMTQTSEQTGVRYGGALAPFTEYPVHVRVTGISGAVAEARTSFRTGRLGTPWTASASFDLDVRDGSLLMRSRSVGLVLGRVRIRLPRTLSPIVRLTESHDPVSGLQRVELTVDAPLLGRVYGYRGHFAYAIVRDAEGADRAG